MKEIKDSVAKWTDSSIILELQNFVVLCFSRHSLLRIPDAITYKLYLKMLMFQQSSF